jgi:peptidyl-prolyl cis-trans isomerase B (cyclophilin B)
MLAMRIPLPSRVSVLPAALAVVATLSLAGCGSESGASEAADTTPTGSTSSASPAEASATADAVSCDYPEDPAGAAKPVDPPPATPTQTGEVAVTIGTSVGDLHATLDADRAPCTVNSFLSLADQGFFDDVACHRMTTAGIYVLQCGDPSGTGAGGPGYSFGDELDGSETYGAGTLAMANAGPDTNGSQFFIVYGDSQLPPAYTVFGHVDHAAVQTVSQVAKKGVDDANGTGDGHPNQEVRMESITVG